MDEQETNQDKKDLPEHPILWLSQILRMHWLEILIEIGKFKEASRRAHVVTLVVVITILLALGLMTSIV